MRPRNTSDDSHARTIHRNHTRFFNDSPTRSAHDNIFIFAFPSAWHDASFYLLVQPLTAISEYLFIRESLTLAFVVILQVAEMIYSESQRIFASTNFMKLLIAHLSLLSSLFPLYSHLLNLLKLIIALSNFPGRKVFMFIFTTSQSESTVLYNFSIARHQLRPPLCTSRPDP